jgi:hypothetical protein
MLNGRDRIKCVAPRKKVMKCKKGSQTTTNDKTLTLLGFIYSVLLSVPPEKPEIMDDMANRVVDLRLGPYRVGQNLSLTCTVLGGQCVWFGSIRMSSLP